MFPRRQNKFTLIKQKVGQVVVFMHLPFSTLWGTGMLRVCYWWKERKLIYKAPSWKTCSPAYIRIWGSTSQLAGHMFWSVPKTHVAFMGTCQSCVISPLANPLTHLQQCGDLSDRPGARLAVALIHLSTVVPGVCVIKEELFLLRF